MTKDELQNRIVEALLDSVDVEPQGLENGAPDKPRSDAEFVEALKRSRSSDKRRGDQDSMGDIGPSLAVEKADRVEEAKERNADKTDQELVETLKATNPKTPGRK